MVLVPSACPYSAEPAFNSNPLIHLALFWEAMQNGSAGDLPEVLSKYSEGAFYDPARHAIQVRG